MDYISGMNIRLPPDQQKWLDAQVAKGEFASADDAVQQMIAERMDFEADDFAGPSLMSMRRVPLIARGEVMTPGRASKRE